MTIISRLRKNGETDIFNTVIQHITTDDVTNTKIGFITRENIPNNSGILTIGIPRVLPSQNVTIDATGRSRLAIFDCIINEKDAVIDGGTGSAGGNTTLTDTGKAWTVNAFAQAKVRITGGTGDGQSRTISSNTADVLTVTSAWTTNPGNDSVYLIYDIGLWYKLKVYPMMFVDNTTSPSTNGEAPLMDYYSAKLGYTTMVGKILNAPLTSTTVQGQSTITFTFWEARR